MELRCGTKVSSSNVRLRLERFAGVFLMAIGIGECDFPTVAFDAGGIRIGDDGVTEGRGIVILVGEGEACADICEVWGSLGPDLKGLKSQDGASFEVNPRVDFGVREPPGCLEDTADRLDFTERNERDGEVLDAPKTLSGGPSGGNSMMMRFGLSSMGVILVVAIIEFRCEAVCRFSDGR